MSDETQIEAAIRDTGIPSLGDGHVDPLGIYPLPSYFGSTNISFAATGGTRNELNLGGSIPGVELSYGAAVSSEYPLNQVNATAGGHSIELDDTPGAERVLIRHNSGAGLEVRPDGTIVISSVGDANQRVQGGLNIVVDGPANLVYNNNVTQEVIGDYNLNVRGNYNINVNGNRASNVTGSDRRTVNGASGDIVRGGLSVTSTQQATMTYLGGLSMNTKGTMSSNVDVQIFKYIINF